MRSLLWEKDARRLVEKLVRTLSCNLMCVLYKLSTFFPTTYVAFFPFLILCDWSDRDGRKFDAIIKACLYPEVYIVVKFPSCSSAAAELRTKCNRIMDTNFNPLLVEGKKKLKKPRHAHSNPIAVVLWRKKNRPYSTRMCSEYMCTSMYRLYTAYSIVHAAVPLQFILHYILVVLYERISPRLSLFLL